MRQYRSKKCNLRLKGAIARPADADEVSEDDILSYSELKGDLLTIGWNNHQMVELVEVDLNGDVVYDDDVCDSGSRGLFARFCAMNEREQTSFMYELTMHICRLVGVCITVWEPSDEFVLNAIELEVSDDQLRRAARSSYAEYLRTTASPFKDPKPDSPESEADDTIRISQQGGHLASKPAIREAENKADAMEHEIRKNSVQRWRTMGNESNSRRQTCARRARRETMRKNTELYFGFAGKGDGFDQYVDFLVHDWMVEIDHQERFKRDVEMLDYDPRLSVHALNEALDEMQEQMHGDPMDVMGLPGYRPEDSRRRIAERNKWILDDIFDYDTFNDLYDDYYDDWFDGIHDDCDCSQCTGEASEERDVFADYRGPDNPASHMTLRMGYARELSRQVPSVIDADLTVFSQSSGKRGSYRYWNEPRKSERDLSMLSL